MKRLFAILTVLCTICSATAENKVVMKAVKSNMQFTEITAGPAVKVFVEDRTEGNIIIRATEKVMPDVDVRVEDGELIVSYKSDIHFKNGNETFAEVYIPNNGKLRSFTAAACAVIEVAPIIKTKKLEIECIGASSIKMSAVADSAEVEVVGASNTILDITTTKFDCELAGAAKATITGSATKAEVEVVGASSLKASGFKASQLDVEVTGASKADLAADMADVDVAGASKVNIECAIQLNASAAGASNISYTGNCHVNIDNNSGASTIKKR